MEMPARLTAENGAKEALTGEFMDVSEHDCGSCGGSGTSQGRACETCHGAGSYVINLYASWTKIQSMYDVVVQKVKEGKIKI